MMVRWFLSHDVSILVADALMISRLDYCNSFPGVSLHSIDVNYNCIKQ